MAQKRMFDKAITNADDFLEMPDSSQNLYFHLNMNADDDGFVNNWKSIMRMTGHKEDDLKILIVKQFVIPFESGVIVIRHWRINNYLRNDRYKATNYQEEYKQLTLDSNGVYNLNSNEIPILNTDGIPMVDTDKNRIEENSIDNKKENKKEKEPKEKYGKYGRVKLTTDEYLRLVNEFGEDFIKNQIDLLDEYVETNNNKNGYKNFNLVLRKSIREKWFERNKRNGGSSNVFLDIMKDEYGR